MTNKFEVANVARRSVLLGLAAGTFVLSARLSSPAVAQEKKFGGEGMPGGLKDDPRIFLSIAEDGTPFACSLLAAFLGRHHCQRLAQHPQPPVRAVREPPSRQSTHESLYLHRQSS
jgi:hypothetical protein